MGNEAQNFLPEMPAQDEPQPGPSWANTRWPLADDAPDLAQAMDPTMMQAAVKQAAASAGKVLDETAMVACADASIRAMLLVRTYRVRGHLAAKLDPLGLSKQEIPADLSPEFHGFSGAALDTKVYLGGTLGYQWATIRELVDTLRAN